MGVIEQMVSDKNSFANYSNFRKIKLESFVKLVVVFTRENP